MKKAELPKPIITRFVLVVLFGFVSFYSACGFGWTITETNGFDFPDNRLDPQGLYALVLGTNTVSGRVTTTSSSSDIDILSFSVPPEYKISSLTLTGATFPTDVTDPVFYICAGSVCGSPAPVTPSTTLPLAFTDADLWGMGIFGDSGSFANCGTTSGCGYTVEILVSAPIPATFWLFASGLLGLVGMRSGKKTA